MEKFAVHECVVVTHDTGTSSGKITEVLGNDTYLVSYRSEGGLRSGEFPAHQLTSFGVSLFIATEAYQTHQSELEEVSGVCSSRC